MKTDSQTDVYLSHFFVRYVSIPSLRLLIAVDLEIISITLTHFLYC